MMYHGNCVTSVGLTGSKSVSIFWSEVCQQQLRMKDRQE